MDISSLLTLDGITSDGPDVVYKLSQLQLSDDAPIEIVSELPAADDPDVILSYVQRWWEIQRYFKRDLRVYAWTYTTEVEKHVLRCVQNMSHICVTTLPTYLKGE